MGTLTIAMSFMKTADKAVGKKSYLARLTPGLRGSLDREFAPRRKGGNNQKCVAIACAPGDVFEARSAHWTGDRHIARTAWFGVQIDGSLLLLTRDEAIHAVHAPRLPGPASAPTGRQIGPAIDGVARPMADYSWVKTFEADDDYFASFSGQ